MLRTLTILVCLGGAAWANGFLVEGEPVPPIRLTVHRVTANVTDRVARVTVEQVFRSQSPTVLEGTYLFPLPRGATVGDFAMTMGDKLIKGEVVEAGRARAIYESIVRSRRDPGLLEYVGRGLFRARVFPIEPGQEIRIRLTFRQMLHDEGGTIEFRYPLATERMNQAAVENTVVDVRFESTIDLKTVYSPSHKIDVSRDGERSARVTFECGRRRAERDFLAYFGRSPDAVGFSLLSSKPDEGDGSFLTVLAPSGAREESELIPKDVVYVVDTSGSMSGRKMEQAKAALDQAVDLLRPHDRFNIVAFSSGFAQFHPELANADDTTRKQARDWIAGLKAGGGTALEAALSHSLRMGSADRLFLVVLITDGRPTVGITGADDILGQAKKANRANARVFTFGVGDDLDVKLLDRIAEGTGGAREYVRPQERIDEVTQRFFKRVDQPVLTDLELTPGPGLVEIYPRRLRDLFAGDQIVVIGRYGKTGRAAFRVTGKRGGKTYQYEYEAPLADKDEAPYLERMWAHRKIAFLLDEIRLNGQNKELTDEIVSLAKRHRIITPYTSGLVLEPGQRIDSAAPIFFSSRGGAFRGPNGGVPPGLRDPSDPEPAPGGPTTPGTPPPPPSDVGVSQDLKDRKSNSVALHEGHIKRAGSKTFRTDKKGRWLDLDWDGKGETKKIVFLSDAYVALFNDDVVVRYLAVGELVVFKYKGEIYEIVKE